MTATLGYRDGAADAATLDERDEIILADRLALLNAEQGPRVGDVVRFADDVIRRVSHIWRDEHGEHLPSGIQTSDGGSYYLGGGYVSMSGSLHPGVPVDTLTDTGATADRSVWFFHHDWHKAHNAVTVSVPFRVFACTMAAN